MVAKGLASAPPPAAAVDGGAGGEVRVSPAGSKIGARHNYRQRKRSHERGEVRILPAHAHAWGAAAGWDCTWLYTWLYGLRETQRAVGERHAPLLSLRRGD